MPYTPRSIVRTPRQRNSLTRWRQMWLLVLVGIVSASAAAPTTHAETPIEQVTHLPQPARAASSWPTEFAPVGDTIYFTTHTSSTGEELWRSDGTDAGTRLVKDIARGEYPSFPIELTDVNGTLFFAANDGSYGHELWRSDGTAEGTALVKDIWPGADGSEPAHFTVANGRLFFVANDRVHGHELWTSDGTEAGTTMVSDLSPGGAGSFTPNDPSTLLAIGDTIFFTTWAGGKGFELWRTDGTATGTQLVKDIAPGSESSYPSELTNVNGTLFFAAQDGTYSYSYDLWRSDGTDAGTTMVKDFGTTSWQGSVAPSEHHTFVAINDTLFFMASDKNDGEELWRSDGTAEGTVLVKDIALGEAASQPTWLTNANGMLVFTAKTADTGRELWTSDGTEAGTALIKDIYEGAESGIPSQFVPYLTPAQGEVFLYAVDATHGSELWRTDGTTGGTSLVKDIQPGSAGSCECREPHRYGYPFQGSEAMLAYGDNVVFAAADNVHGSELWRSDGTDVGTALVKDINTTHSVYSTLTPFRDQVMLALDDGVHGYEPWISDGTASGTALLKDIAPGIQSSAWYPAATVTQDAILFEADDGTHGRELWRTDGTAAGTHLVQDIRPGTGSSVSSTDFVNVNGTVFFTAYGPNNNEGLWKTNGTAPGTIELAPLDPISFCMTNVNEQLVFFAHTRSDDPYQVKYGLWTSDGTVAGSTRVAEIRFKNNTVTSDFCPVGVDETIFFLAYDTTHGTELWSSDGTAAGTRLVKDIAPGWTDSSSRLLTSAQGRLFFVANDGSSGDELWTSDGTAEGTVRLSDLYPGAGSSAPQDLVAVDNQVFFTATDAAHGRELWTSDGTTNGTRMVADIVPGRSGSTPSTLTANDGEVVFAANDPEHGQELWQSDGTVNGTRLMADLWPGTNSGNPRTFTMTSTRVFFLADDQAGTSLWTMPRHGSAFDVFLPIAKK